VTRRLGLAGLGLATLLPMLAGSMANLVLPALGQDFGVPFASLQWVLVAYLLGITSLTVVAGRLGDRLGRRRLLLWGTGVFALASLLCALASSIGWLIAARTLQGAGAACMLVLSLAMAGELVPPARRGWSMGLLGTLSACGTALGPSFGGLLIGGFGWQAPFLLLLPLALLALGCAWRDLPRDEAGSAEGSLPLTSLLLLVTALLCYGLALTRGSPLGVWPGIGALVAMVLFVRADSGARRPLLPLALLGASRRRGGIIASALVASVMVATLLIGPFYLHGAFALDMGTVGLMISMGPLLAALSGMPAGWLVDRVGAHGGGRRLAGLAGQGVRAPRLPAAHPAAHRRLCPVPDRQQQRRGGGGGGGEPWRRGRAADPVAQPGPADGGGGAGGPVRRPGGAARSRPRDGGRAGVCHPGHLRPDGLAADERALAGGKGGACRAG